LDGEARGTRLTEFDEENDGALVQTIEPALRLILLGDGSDSVALRAHASLLGWDVLQFDAAPVDPELLDNRTAVVVATHNYGRDCAALRDLLPVGLKYLGVVGSRRRRDDIVFDVMNSAIAPESDLFAPAGLHFGAECPQEIALSIVGEIQSVFGAGTNEHLRDRKAAIHAGRSEECAASVH
jgi:xanthine/CO dehydrogenase XdhC/CoxF family maturation factor